MKQGTIEEERANVYDELNIVFLDFLKAPFQASFRAGL